MIRITTFLLLALLVVIGCERHAAPVPIEELELIKDDVRKFEVKVPQNWTHQILKGELILASANPKTTKRFLDFSKGEGGAKVELRAVQITDSTRVMDSLIKNSKVTFEDGLDRYEIENATLGGKPAKKLWVAFDQEDGQFRSEAYFAENDSVVTILTLAAFGATFDDYKDEFAQIISSVKLARRPDAPKGPDTLAPTGPQPPSDTLRRFSSPQFVIQIPQNFDGKRLSGAGIESVNFVGSRRDCNIQVDVFDASKQKALDKILLQNKPNYGGKDPFSTNIGGQKGAYFEYAPTSKINSRAYFVLNNKKLYRITMNWYKPDEKLYLPVFEKCIKSFGFQ